MEKHNGQIAEYLVRKYGYSITDLALQLNVNRRSLYNYFRNKNLQVDILLRIGIIIRHDFSAEFPEFFSGSEFKVLPKSPSDTPTLANSSSEEEVWKSKYIDLLEQHRKLLLKCLDKNSDCCLTS
ncbi:TetR/AcrR family transcriptional regulator [Mucilaginibacter pallidiroseus]|uniref:TetR/AcrR family transcriptional regulator n=1 Tax=Mucilaginibacter pallidiroseus TaxID=2599295 RepID=A0A563UBX3_9SPHI|nr:TetR/AcrR family transcriptional regulator [Mucilaginibacter pallidiroseus]TWR28872.1 TetR/AcrR family transcriptional regulator [Mucilaginibacter pallidiroseus]